jgi:hypothetical protein
MKELTLGTMIAVFEEMFGRALFWGLVLAVLAVTLLFFFVLIRDRGLHAGRFLRAQLALPVGAVLAPAFVFWITRSGLGDLGGPIDVIVLLLIALFGAIGAAILGYTAMALAASAR